MSLERNYELAELIGIILGDGHIHEPTPGKSYIGYELSITINRIDNKEYVGYVKKLINKIFGLTPHSHIRKKRKAIELIVSRKYVVEELKYQGMVSGVKSQKQVCVPQWIFPRRIFEINPDWIENNKEQWTRKYKSHMLGCLKGLFDTDGGYYVDKKSGSIVITFNNTSLPLVLDFKNMCDALGIESQPKILKEKYESDITEYESFQYKMSINKKDSVKSFFELVLPEKWKDPNRREFTGLNLIYIRDKNKKKIIQAQIWKDYPKRGERQFSIEYLNYLRNLCEKYGYLINEEEIEKAIKEALSYIYSHYTKEFAECLKNLFENYGNILAIRDHFIKKGEKYTIHRNTIKKYLKLLFNEKDYINRYGLNGFNEWHKKYYRKRPFTKPQSKLQEVFKLLRANPNREYSVDDIILQTGFYPKYIGNILYQLRLNGFIKEVGKIGHKKIYQLIN